MILKSLLLNAALIICGAVCNTSASLAANDYTVFEGPVKGSCDRTVRSDPTAQKMRKSSSSKPFTTYQESMQ